MTGFQSVFSQTRGATMHLSMFNDILTILVVAMGSVQGEVMTDMFYPIYPDGLYNAIKR